MKKIIFIAALTLLHCTEVSSQIVISAGTTISVANSPDIVIATGSNVSNNSSFDFSTAQLHLALAGTNQTINGNIVAKRLLVGGGGTKTLNGNLTVTEQINFQDGFLKPSATTKLLFTGSQDGLLNYGSTSFVDGRFFTNGSGFLTFPVGVQGFGYAPVSIENAAGPEIGVEVINDDPALTPAPTEVELAAVSTSHYWEITTADLTSFNSVINLSMNGTSPFGPDLSAVVVEAESAGGEAYNLGSLSTTEASITSLTPFSRRILTIGASTSIDIKIHDLISPFTPDNINDQLYIENISKFPINSVTLLDRWGGKIKEWKNFTNYTDPLSPNEDNFNFAKLSPGNYICVVEYASASQKARKKSQMVTVLKIN